jgi:hypothetical protein
MNWPHDDNAALIAFYGDPASRVFAQNLVPFTPPWQMSYKNDDGKVTKVTHFVVHRKCLDAFTRIFAAIWTAYGRDQSRIEADNLHWYGGCYAQRPVRGSSTKLSTHAFAAAIDLDPEHNPLNRTHTSHMPQVVIDAFKAEGAFWGGDFKQRSDPMHFQFATEYSASAIATAGQGPP